MPQLKRHVLALLTVIVAGTLLGLVPIDASIRTIEIGGSLFYKPAFILLLIGAIPFAIGGYIARSGFVATAAVSTAFIYVLIVYLLHQISLPANPDAQWSEIARINALNFLMGYVLILACAYLGQRLYSRRHDTKPPDQSFQLTGER